MYCLTARSTSLPSAQQGRDSRELVEFESQNSLISIEILSRKEIKKFIPHSVAWSNPDKDPLDKLPRVLFSFESLKHRPCETGESLSINSCGYSEDWSRKENRATGDKAIYKAITGAKGNKICTYPKPSSEN